MGVCAYLNFNGTCGEAFRMYERVLNGTIVMMQTHGESPMKDQVSPEWRDKVIHARLTVGDSTLMGSDVPPQFFTSPQGFGVSLTVPTTAEAERIFHGLSEGGRITMPFEATFWSPGFGMVVDRFGTPWLIGCEPAA